MSIANADLSTTDTTLITVPSGSSYAIITVLVCNTGTNAQSFDAHVIKSGQTKSDTNKVLTSVSVQGKDTFTFNTERLILDAADSLVLFADSDSGLHTTVSYLEV